MRVLIECDEIFDADRECIVVEGQGNTDGAIVLGGLKGSGLQNIKQKHSQRDNLR